MTTTTMPIPHHQRHRVTHRRRQHGRTVSFSLLLFLLFLLSLLSSAKAQPSGSSSRDTYRNWRGGFGPAMGIMVVILISAFFFMVFFCIYLRQCSERAELSGGAGPRALQGARSRRSAARGLDPAVVQAFPTLVYAEVKEHKIGKGALECAVCLCEFEDDETLRLLPKCDHVFHPDCIDSWLFSHTTCPVCRCNLASPDPNAAAITAAAEATVNPSPDTGASTAPVSGETQRVGGAGGQLQDHVAIVVDEPEAGDRMRRMESKSRLRWLWSRSLGRPPRFPRSHSTGHSMAVMRPEKDCERYTLRLPDHIRRDVIAGKFQRSSSCSVFPAAGEGSSTRKGNQTGGEGTSRGAGGSVGGRSFKQRRWEWAAKSDRWAFFARTFSMVVPRGDDGAADGSAGRGEGSSTSGAEGGGSGAAAGGEGSVKGKAFPAA